MINIPTIGTKIININPPVLAIVVPCYNESEVIAQTYAILSEFIARLVAEKKIDSDSFLVFVDDGSIDDTYLILNKLSQDDSGVKLIKFSRNFGHQNALLAGMFSFCKESDCMITIDADLQDDLSVISDMIERYQKGAQLVYGVRSKRQRDSFFKRFTAEFFYKLMHFMGVELIFNHADFRLASKEAIIELARFEEVNLFLRGIFPQLGFQSAVVEYERKERQAGQTKYPFLKMLSFAVDGITSFTIKPLRMVTFIGMIIFAISLILSLFTLVSYYNSKVIPGWASIALPIYFLGGIQLLSIGIVGEYIGKIYKEVKRRPRYIIEELK